MGLIDLWNRDRSRSPRNGDRSPAIMVWPMLILGAVGIPLAHYHQALRDPLVTQRN